MAGLEKRTLHVGSRERVFYFFRGGRKSGARLRADLKFDEISFRDRSRRPDALFEQIYSHPVDRSQTGSTHATLTRRGRGDGEF